MNRLSNRRMDSGHHRVSSNLARLRHLVPPVPTLVVGVVATMMVLSGVPSLRPGPNSLIAPNGRHLGIQITDGNPGSSFTVYQPPELWSGGSPVEACSACDLQSLTGTPQGQSTQPGQPVDAATGDFTKSVPLFSIPEPGGSMDATMTYDSYRAQADLASGGSAASIEWGLGWQSSLTAYLTPGLAPMVTEENGAEVNFSYAPMSGICPLGDYSDPAKYTGVDSAFQFCAPYRVNAQLSELTTNGNITGWYLFEEGGRTVLSFNASGQLTDVGTLSDFDAETYLYGQTNQTNSACPSNGTTIFSCTVITDPFGRQIVIEQNQVSQVVGILDPMGRLYSWTFQPTSSYVASIANPDGTTSFTYTTSLGSPFSADMQTVTDPDNYTRHIGYNLTGQVASITDFADLNTTTYTYQGSCSNLSCTGPGDSRTTTVTYPDQEIDTDYFYEGVLVTDTWGTTSSGNDQSQVEYIYNYPAYDSQDQDNNITLQIERPNTSGVAFTIVTDAVGNVISVADMYNDYITNQYNDSAGNDLNELCWTVQSSVSTQTDVSCQNTPPTGAASFQYDSNGNITSTTDYNQVTTRYGYYYSGSALNDLPCWVAPPTVTGAGTNCTTSPAGNAPTDSTAYSYDSYGDVSMVNKAYGDATWETTSTSTHDADGELTSSTPPDAYSRGTNPGSGNAAYLTAYGLDGDGRVLYLYSPGPESDGYEVTNYGYDADGNVTTVDNQSTGAVTTNVYDGDNRLCWTYQGTSVINNTSCTRPSGATGNYYSYDTSALAYTTNPNGNTTSYSYGDPAFPTEATAVSDPMAASVVYNTYNQLGSVCTSGPAVPMVPCQWEQGQGNTYDGYDSLDRLTVSTDPSENTTNYGYGDSNYPNLMTSMTNALNQQTSYGYDPDGRENVVSGAASNSVTQTGYDTDGRMCYKINALVQASCSSVPTTAGDSGYSYNPLNQLQTMTDYGLGTSSFSYDNSGNLLQQTNDNGQVTTYAYDVANDVTCVGYSVAANPNCANPGSSTNTVVNYGYQYIGKISDTLDWLGNETHYGYTSDGELNLASVSYPSGTGETINYGYDAANNLTSSNYAGPAVGTQSQSWTPNADSLVSATSQLGSYNSSPTYDGVHNWVASATNPGNSGADSYQYQPNGELSSDLAPNGLGPYYAYNGADELTSGENTNTDVVSTFAYNANGERCWSAPTNVSNPTCSSPPSGATSYAWNAYGQLCWAGNSTSTNGCSSPPSGTTSYQYDGTDLRSTATSGPVAAWSAPSTIDSRGLGGVSCPTTSFCVAVDAGGYALKYNGSSWSSFGDIDAGRVLNNISCISSIFCMAVDDSGYAIKYNGSSWTASHIDGSQQLLSISCVSSTFCVAGDGAGHALMYNGSNWPKTTLTTTNSVQGVSCTSTSFCMAIDGGGHAFKYTGSWSAATTIDTRPTTAISCSTSTFCAVVDFDGYAVTYNGSAWSSPHDIDGTHILISVSCTSSAFCQTTDTVGNALLYNGTTWTPLDIDGSSYLASVSCQSTTFCEAVDGAGHALAYQPTTVTSHLSWDVVSGGGLPRLLTDGTNAYIYGPTLFGGSAPVEQISLTTHTPEYLSSIPSGVQLVFGASGSLINRSSYSTYGTQTNTSSSGPATPFGFQGGYTDATGLIYLINRYYDSNTAQFISVDPLVAKTGQPYAFAGDNPLNARDPNGLCSWYNVWCEVVQPAANWFGNNWQSIVFWVAIGIGVVAFIALFAFTAWASLADLGVWLAVLFFGERL